MPLLDPSEYEASYFDGYLQPLAHNAGYSTYTRWRRHEGPNSLGEFWKDYAAGWINNLALSGKKVLEIGCAKGFLVEDLVDAGVDAYGLDVSDWCINSCNDPRTDAAARIRRPDLAGRFFLGDARTSLAQFSRNQFDVLFTKEFIVCISDADLPALITEMNRISRLQVHVLNDFTSGGNASQYYTARTLSNYLSQFGWARGTRLLDIASPSTVLVK